MKITREQIGNDIVYNEILKEVKKQSSVFGKLFKGEFSEEEAAKVTTLTLRDEAEIKNFEFVRHLPNLKQISLIDVTGVESVFGLTYAPELADVWISNTYVPNLAELAGCRNLTDFAYICDEGNERMAHRDFSVLRNFAKLQNLALVGNTVTELDYLVDCRNIEEIHMERCNLSTIAPLQQLPKLATLVVENCNLTELEDIDKFQALKYVRVESLTITEEQIQAYRELCPNVKISYSRPEEEE